MAGALDAFGLGLNLDPSLPLLRALSLHFPVCKNGNFMHFPCGPPDLDIPTSASTVRSP